MSSEQKLILKSPKISSDEKKLRELGLFILEKAESGSH